MRLKADCLFDAGVIDAEDRLAVYARTGAVLAFAETGGAPPSGARLREWRPAAFVH